MKSQDEKPIPIKLTRTQIVDLLTLIDKLRGTVMTHPKLTDLRCVLRYQLDKYDEKQKEKKE